MEVDGSTIIAALIGVVVALMGLLPFVIRTAVAAGKTLAEVRQQGLDLKKHGVALQEHGDTLAEHGRILTNGLRDGVRENTQSIKDVKRAVGQIHDRLRTLPCTPPVLRCRPAAPQQSERGEDR